LPSPKICSFKLRNTASRGEGSVFPFGHNTCGICGGR
jgi:hypothetical protein